MATIRNLTEGPVVLNLIGTKTGSRLRMKVVDGVALQEPEAYEYSGVTETLHIPASVRVGDEGEVKVTKAQLKSLQDQKPFMGMVEAGMLRIEGA